MGTNYYLHTKPPCDKCGRPFEAKHIGKSSGGWCFSIHVIPEEGINDLEDWQKLLSKKGAFILDEYGDRVSKSMMMKIITERKWLGTEFVTQQWYASNFAEPGPNGLVRHAIGNGCVKQGKGTWDCIEGEFS